MKPPNEMAKFDVYDAKNMAASILQGDRAPLARAITLMESNRPEHRALARAILKELRKSPSSAAGMNPGDLAASSDEPALNTEAGVADPADRLDPAGHADPVDAADPTDRLDHADRLDLGERPDPADPSGRPDLADPADPASRGGTNTNELETESTRGKYTYRIGITGVPGVGKSSFIEKFGLYAIEKGHRVAVLAIDPTSALSKGSILGDKTKSRFRNIFTSGDK